METTTEVHNTDISHKSPPTLAAITPRYWIHNIPDELLSEVLAAVAPGRWGWEDRLHWSDDLPEPDFRVVAQLVCRRWRTVALHTPSLWSFVDSKVLQATNATLFLHRSGVLPLSVSLNITDDIYHSAQLRQNFETTFQENSSRVSKIYLNGAYLSVFLTLFQHLFANLSKLRELTLIHGFLSDWAPMPTCADLESLSIVESTATPISQHSFFAALRGCPRLRVLQLENQDFGEWADEEIPQHFVLHALKKVTLRRFFMWEMMKIFKVMGTPTLNELVVAGVSSRMESELPLELPCPELETLVLEGLPLSFELAQALSHARHLAFIKTRHINPEEVDRQFQSLLTHWAALSGPIPLETLTTDNIRLSSLLPLIKSNYRGVVPRLRKITVHYLEVFCSGDPREFKRRYKEWSKLSSLLEMEVYGIPGEAVRDRAGVASWEDEQKWCQEWDLPSEPS